MTPRASHHAKTARKFLAKAYTYLAEGDLNQASEKGWAAVAWMVKAVAEERNWEYRTQRDLYCAVDRIAEEAGDERIQTLFSATSALRQNFYEGNMPESTVASGLKDVEEITNLLAVVID